MKVGPVGPLFVFRVFRAFNSSFSGFRDFFSPCRARIGPPIGVEIAHHGDALAVAFDDDGARLSPPQHVEILRYIVLEIVARHLDEFVRHLRLFLIYE